MSDGSAAESIEACRRRRRAAGQSGGQFEMVRYSGAISYRYVWSDKEKHFVDQLGAWTCAESTEDLVVTESEKTPIQDSQAEIMRDKLDEEGVVANVSNTGTKTAHEDVGCMEIMASGKANGNERRAFGRLNIRISGWLQSEKDDCKEDADQRPALEFPSTRCCFWIRRVLPKSN
ncbi:uncharacterized protein Z519_05055 [Cladophialophora bantiana CBS 173.52]|uniref:Uncharacterized protein n=1 Tax=Cladophialophora bantiana (strain ATCC 10958 / CBS 173.52 / CDC B-1940 / NIH 8579) TaxID=1442370 RepID=A0A0D2HS91_CLAB1|nr:uncharacterized protein Z519_05055 [Cladophialophora bantiana CBS 173.52]KIW93740.1 hypothetical protein Z519_05055 [Cladophialophora bantiana CBS 173.52]